MFYNQLKQLCESENMSVTTFLKEKLNLSTGKGTAWKNGSIPKYEILHQISEYFNVPISYLFEEKEDYSGRNGGFSITADQIHEIRNNSNVGDNVINVPAQKQDEMTTELIKRFSELSFDDKLNVFNYIKNMEE